MSPESMDLKVEARTDEDSMQDVMRLANAGVIPDAATIARLLNRCVQIKVANGPWQYLDGEPVSPERGVAR